MYCWRIKDPDTGEYYQSGGGLESKWTVLGLLFEDEGRATRFLNRAKDSITRWGATKSSGPIWGIEKIRRAIIEKATIVAEE